MKPKLSTLLLGVLLKALPDLDAQVCCYRGEHAGADLCRLQL